jgi:steroid delta-isomerase-like uncharacterized protein
MSNKETTKRFFDEVWNQGKLDVLDEIMTADAQNHDAQNPFTDVKGPEMMKKTVGMYREGFADLNFTVDDLLEDGDKVVARWTATGTNNGPMMGMPATGKTSTSTGMTINRFVDGKVAESWSSWDTLGMLQNLGVVPKMG